jgi:hypothetical protein
MKKLLINLILFIIIFIIGFIIVISTVGIETSKFNNLISDKASQTKKIKLELDTIKFKINPTEPSLFLETQNPKIKYRDISIPVKNIKVYIDFFSLLKSNPKIKKTSLSLEELDITRLNKLSIMMKPSNFKSLLNNKIKEGKLFSEIDIFLTEEGLMKNFIVRGTVKDLKAELLSGLSFTETNLKFFADKNDILIQNIFGNLEEIKINNGDIKLNLENGIKLNSNFNSKFNFDEKILNKFSKNFKKYKFLKNIKNLKADLSNNLSVELDNTYKIKDYNYSISGNLKKGEIELSNPVQNNFLTDDIKRIYLSDLQIKMNFVPKNIDFKSEGKYSFNELDFLKIKLENNFNNDLMNLKLDFDYKNGLELAIINYKKAKNSLSTLSFDLEKNKDNIKINKIKFVEGKNSFKANNLRFKDNKFLSFKKIEVTTSNNDFSIHNDKKIIIKGNKFDATNLVKFLNKQRGENQFQNLNNNIEIDFKNIKVPMSEKLQNFKLIGEIKKGQFVKIISKGDYGGNNYLDISMKKDKGSNKKYLEIYSDLTRPLLTEYSFFKGLSGGKLFFTSIIDGSTSSSKLKIEKFKVVNAPGVIKLLSLADLGGLADLAEGDGLSFDKLEINMEKNERLLKINEILALGTSMSVLMEGYQDENGFTSLRGSLVPAKTLNNIISKIPVIGSIVIPKEVGEGLFGISFKMKGPKGKIKTSINPIRTLTPRFLQKIIDRDKETK